MKELKKITPTRARADLEGFWRFQPMAYNQLKPKEGNWLYAKPPTDYCKLIPRQVKDRSGKKIPKHLQRVRVVMVPGDVTMYDEQLKPFSFNYYRWKTQKMAQASLETKGGESDVLLDPGGERRANRDPRQR